MTDQLNVLFITQDDPIYVREFFDEFLELRIDGIRLLGIVLAPAMGKKKLRDLVSQMWGFYGPVDFFRMGFRFAKTKFLAGLPNSLRFGRTITIQQIADRHGVPVKFVADLNDAAFVDWVRQKGIDVVASVAAPQIIKEDLIDAPRIACINIHNATLPKYRGMLPNFWQMLHGEESVGTTVHKINKGIDDGPILAQSETRLLPDESLDGVIRRTKRAGAHLMLEVLTSFRHSTVRELPNDSSDGSYFSFPTRADVAEFRRRGYKLL